MPGEYSGYDPLSLLSEHERRVEEEKASSIEEERHTFQNPVTSKQPESDEDSLAREYVRKGILTSNVQNDQRERVLEATLAQNLGQSPLGTVGPNEGYEFEGAEGDMAEAQRQRFLIDDSDAAMLQPEQGIDPTNDSGDSWDTTRNVMNFLFSDEMGLLGIKWTEDSATWAWKNFKTQLQEHPYSTAFTLASYMVPIGAAWMKSARVARRGAELAEATSSSSRWYAPGDEGSRAACPL
jgi:hypothetical protein